MSDQITWEELEAAIDLVGRDKVIARALQVGWTAANPPPMWVWNCIVSEIAEQNRNRLPRDMPIDGKFPQ